MNPSRARLRIEVLEGRITPAPATIGFGTGVRTLNVAGYNLRQDNANFPTTSSAFGFSEAVMTQPQQVDTLNGGLVNVALNDAFDGVLSFGISPNGTQVSAATYFDADGVVDITGNVITGDPNTVGTDGTSFGGLQLSQQNAIFALNATTPVIRSVLTITNPTAAPITRFVGVFNNLGSDANTRIFATSSGDATFDDSVDRWVGTFQNFSGTTSTDVRLLHVMQGPGTVASPYTALWAGNGDDNPNWVYNVTVGPGETKSIMEFIGLYATRAQATADGAIFDSNATVLSNGLLAGLSQAQLATVVNWDFSDPAINLVKLTNGTDNDAAPGVFVPVGSTVTFTYVVTNPGNVPLSGVAVTDDNGTPGSPADDFAAAPVLAPGTTFNIGDTDQDNLLDTTETWTFTATRVATPGPFTNTAAATGTSQGGGETVTATAVDNHFGAVPAISAVKLTNGTDNDTAPGVFVPAGSTVTFTYVVTNPGNVPLSGVTVTDDAGTPGNPADDFAVTFVGGDTNANGLLDPTETWAFTASRVATPGQYTNVATATGTPPAGGGPAVTDTNPDNHFGAVPAINLVKLTNGTDNDAAPGVFVPVGSTVTFTYLVSNPGNVPLSGVVVTDDRG